jgi:hypothetical protein
MPPTSHTLLPENRFQRGAACFQLTDSGDLLISGVADFSYISKMALNPP